MARTTLKSGLTSLGPSLWAVTGPQKFKLLGPFGLEIGNIGLLVHDRDKLVAINCPPLPPSLSDEIRALEKQKGAKLCLTLLPGDWHHSHIPAWAEAFPDSKFELCSERIMKHQPVWAEKCRDRITVLDTEHPVSNFDLKDTIELIPFLGCKQPSIAPKDERGNPRVEIVVYYKPSKLLYITDHVFAPKTSPGFLERKLLGTIPDAVQPNTGGFLIVSPKLADASAKRILELPIDELVFSHGTTENFRVGPPSESLHPKDLLAEAYKMHFLEKTT